MLSKSESVEPIFFARFQWFPEHHLLVFLPTVIHDELLSISMGFFRLQTSYSNLPKQVGILSPSIQIVLQNIENSRIDEHVKIELGRFV